MSAPGLLADADRIMIVCPTWVGDTVMATPLLRAIRNARPNATLIGVTRPGLDPLLNGCPWLDACTTLDPRGLTGPWRAARSVRTERPDAVLLLPNSFRSALVAWLARVPIRIGYDRDGRRRLLTHPVSIDRRERPTPMLDYFRHLAGEMLGEEIDDALPHLEVTPEEAREAETLLADVEAPFAVLVPGANRADKRWPAERFAAVADALRQRHGVQSLLSGGPSEHAVLSSVRDAATTGPVDLSARGLSLGTLKAVMQRASLVITNDTGPRHIAVAVGTPVVCMFGPTDARWTHLPGAREHVLSAEPFLPEELIADRRPKLCAIDRIPVEDVLTAAERMLAGPEEPGS